MSKNYIELFSTLHTAKIAGKNAPHKAILLLAIMDLVESGDITSPRIVLTEQLEKAFNSEWSKFVGVSVIFQPKVATPFWHMQNEPFYKLYLNDGQDTSSISNPYSVKRLRENTYAMIDRDLFEAMQNQNARAELRVALISTYLHGLHSGMVNAMTLVGLISLVIPFAA